MSLARDIERLRAHQRRMKLLADALIAFNVFIIIGVTLYPFDFTTDGFRDRLDSMLAPNFKLRGLWDDVVTNIVLFIPLGYALATLAHRQSREFLRGLVFVILASAAISLSVEVLQLYLPFRFSSFVDVGSNAFGAGVGYIVKTIIGSRIASHIGAAMSGADNGKARFWLAASYAGYLGFILLLSVPLFYSLHFADWHYAYPLTVGNEPTGARPWSGTIERLAISYHAAEDEQIAKSFATDSLVVVSRTHLVADYVFSGAPPFIDRSKKLPPLVARGKDPFPDRGNGIVTTPRRWLETEKEAFNFRAYVSEKEEFTIFLKLQSALKQEKDQARIFAVARDPYHTNLALAQDNDQLCIRLRTMATGMNGSNPMLAVSGAFTDTLMHTIIVRYRERTISVWKDGTPLIHEFTVGPGLATFNRFLPSKRKLEITSPFAQFNEWLFAAFAFVPLGVLLAFVVRSLHFKTIGVILAAIVGVLVPPFGFERLGMYMIGRPISFESVMGNCAVVACALLLSLLYIARTRRMQSAEYAVNDDAELAPSSSN